MRHKWSEVPVSADKIRLWFGRANDTQRRAGTTWYKRANRKADNLSCLGDHTTDTIAAVMAVLSPGVSWERVVYETTCLVKKIPVVCTTYGQFVDKAKLLLEGYDPAWVVGGKKVTSFYKLISNPLDDETVCVDRHAARVCTEYEWESLEQMQKFLNSQYHRCVAAYQTVAKEKRILPWQVQAVTWEAYRNRKRAYETTMDS